jgi:hypothetical protein
LRFFSTVHTTRRRNSSARVVSYARWAFDTTLSLSLRTSAADVDLEFVKDFANYRFDPEGRWVVERLWQEGTIEE